MHGTLEEISEFVTLKTRSIKLQGKSQSSRKCLKNNLHNYFVSWAYECLLNDLK
jgi:hypothetical protein